MKTLIVYDSVFGNTERVAMTIHNAIRSVLNPVGHGEIMPVGRVTADNLQGLSLLVVGSPTRGFRPTEAVSKFIKGLSPKQLAGVSVATFDTRIVLETIDSSVLRFIVDKGGYAAKKIASALTRSGGSLLIPPEGFFVTGEQGPLKDGELERADAWGKQVVQLGGWK